MRTRLPAALLIAALVFPAAGFAAESVSGAFGPSSYEEYGQRVTAAIDEVDDIVDGDRDSAALAASATRLQELLPVGEEVLLPDGNVVAVDNTVFSSLASRLGSATGDDVDAIITDMSGHLASLSRALGEPGEVPAQDDEALARLLGVHAEEPSAFSEWFAGFVERIGEALQRWWSAAGSPGGRTAMQTATYVLLVAMALFIAYVAIRTAVRVSRGLTPVPAASGDPIDPESLDAADTGPPGDPLGLADALAARGQTREAVRALFRGATHALVDAGVVVQATTRTNAELLGEATRSAFPAHDPLVRLTLGFERAWYGHHAPDTAAFGSARNDYLAVHDALATPPAAAALAGPPATPPGQAAAPGSEGPS
jgi:hypothetical protein